MTTGTLCSAASSASLEGGIFIYKSSQSIFGANNFIRVLQAKCVGTFITNNIQMREMEKALRQKFYTINLSQRTSAAWYLEVISLNGNSSRNSVNSQKAVYCAVLMVFSPAL